MISFNFINAFSFGYSENRYNTPLKLKNVTV